jgi:glycosyltransferase involved in cell wall biosynthesis
MLLVLASHLLRAKVVVTLHSYRLTGFKKILSDTVLRLSNVVICVNPDIKSSLGHASALVKEAFLPPVDEESTVLPGEIEAFMERNRDSMLICANAYRLTRHEGKDLYGLDQCLAIARQAKAKRENIAILFVVGTVMASDDLYYAAQKAIADEELEGFIMVYPQSLDFISLIRRSDIVLRPTVTDGDALTIREALYLGKPVIASDVVARPAGTITYRSEDIDELYATITNVASEIAKGQSDTAESIASSTEEYKKFYLEVYKKCIS